MGIRVLFVYPNTYGMNMLPPAVALFSAILKQEGHKVDIFDATYYQSGFGVDSDGTKAKRLNVVPFENNGQQIKMKTTDWRDDIREKIQSYRPELIAISSTEDMWNLGLQMIEEVEDYIVSNRVPVIAGGVFATFAPDIAIKHRLINMVCVGEGEIALKDLCDRVEKGNSFNDVTNLWVKQKDGTILKNSITKPFDIDDTPIIDLSLFEDQRLYRPMSGKWYRMMPVETHRGCPYKCTYCNSPDQETLYKEQTHADFFRKKKIDLVYRDLKHYKDDLNIEYNYFWADTFLSWNNREFEEFCDMYKDIGLPFWMQTRPETMTDYKAKRLAEVGLHRISFGLEHGNEEFRTKMLDRRWKNSAIIEALKIPHKYGIQFSVNNITGFPTETRELAMDTVELNRYIDADNQNMYPFVPFHGTPLRKKCEELGLIDHETITRAYMDDPMLEMPQYPIKEIAGIIKCFVLYVKFPKERWWEIKLAEANTAEGNKIFQNLYDEYLEKYLPNSGSYSIEEQSKTADLEYGLAQE